MDELLDEHVLGGSDGLVFLDEVVLDGEDEVGVTEEVGEAAHGIQAMLKGIARGAGFALSGAGSGGLLRVGPIGREGGFGHGLLAGLGSRSLGGGRHCCGGFRGGWQRTQVVVLCIAGHEMKLAVGVSGLMFWVGGVVENRGNKNLKSL